MTKPAEQPHGSQARPAHQPEPIRLICLDVDGTLLDSKLTLRDNVMRSLQRAQKAGVDVAVVTGRNLHSTQHILDAIGLKVAVITCSGAHILAPDGRTQEVCLEQEQAAFIVGLALGEDSGVFCDRPGPSWSLGNEQYLERFAGVSTNLRTNDVARALDPSPIKISIINERPTLDRFRGIISARYPDLQLAAPFLNVLDVTPRDATKGLALHTLGKMLGVPLQQVAAIGDSENDLTIFDESGLSIAMANAPAEVRSAADWVAPSNDEDGVAWAVDRILASNITVVDLQG